MEEGRESGPAGAERKGGYMLRDDADYHDLGPSYFDALDKERSAARLVSRLRTVGYEVD